MERFDDLYCSMLGIVNPYTTLGNRLSKDFPRFDGTAYKKNPKYRFVYDKLFIAQSQGMAAGPLQELTGKTDIAFPIFIKPRYGHQTSSSKDCYKIKSAADLAPHLGKPDMMWSEFVDATEGMTDFVLVDGTIVYQLSYKYSEKQNGFADVWKYIDPRTQPPAEVVDWVAKHMGGYTGPFNAQYRATKIIEVGLRFARTGMYIESAGCKPLVDAINRMWETKTWSVRNEAELQFEPFYSFKCWSPMPVVYLLPQHILDLLLRWRGAMPFYEFYFEPTGTTSTIFFQFLHKDFEKGMRLKETIERTSLVANVSLLVLLAVGVVLGVWTGCYVVVIVAFLFVLTSLDNSLMVVAAQLKNQKQFLLG
jgi:hypothetical protein